MSMGEHTEITAKEWEHRRATSRTALALESHQRAVAAWERGFFDDLVIPVGDLRRDTHPAQRHVAREAREAAARRSTGPAATAR